MERVNRAWEHLHALPGYNAAVLVATLLIGIVFLWATAGCTRINLKRYRPQRPWRTTRTEGEILQGRRAWSLAFVLLSCGVIWSAYRVYALWGLAIPVNDIAILVEIPRIIAALWVGWAWWPGVEVE
ncbi:MAG: hypothetical protein QM692_15120 [Thermomicrobiales bacterium]